jgi:hypothetical protein
MVGPAICIFNGDKNIFSFPICVISKDFLIGGPARQEVPNVGNAETKAPNAGAASALPFFHRYSLQPFDAHQWEVCDGLGE